MHRTETHVKSVEEELSSLRKQHDEARVDVSIATLKK